MIQITNLCLLMLGQLGRFSVGIIFAKSVLVTNNAKHTSLTCFSYSYNRWSDSRRFCRRWSVPMSVILFIIWSVIIIVFGFELPRLVSLPSWISIQKIKIYFAQVVVTNANCVMCRNICSLQTYWNCVTSPCMRTFVASQLAPWLNVTSLLWPGSPLSCCLSALFYTFQRI